MAGPETQNKIVIYLSRALGLHLDKERDPVALTKGRNVVDKEVADHPFVQAHFMDGAQAEALAGADAALIAANADLTAKLADAVARAEAAEAKVAEQQAMLDAFNATGALSTARPGKQA